VKTESLETFPHIRNGYHPFAVDAYISKLETKQQSLLDKVETLKARLDESTLEAGACKEEVGEVESLKARLEESTKEAASLREEVGEVESLKARLEESTKEAASARGDLDEVASLKARLEESTKEAASLRGELADLADNSPTPHAMADRMSKMLQIAVDEAAEMHAEAEAKAGELIATTKTETEAARRKQKEMLAGMAAQQSAVDAECEQTRKELEAELAKMRAEAESAIADARQDAQQQREKLLDDAKNEADRYHDQVQRAVEEANRQRTSILEQMMSLCRGLEAIPTTFDDEHQENKKLKNSVISFPFEQKVADDAESSTLSEGTGSEESRFEASVEAG
jgi:DNA repair exonuclease SbcCD ATPase subunit